MKNLKKLSREELRKIFHKLSIAKCVFIVLIFLSQTLFSQKDFVIYANVSGAENGNKVYYYYYENATTTKTDSATINNGKFNIKGSISYPTLFTIYKKSDEDNGKKYYHFFFGEGNVNLDLNFSNFGLSSINKNPYQEEFLRYNTAKNTIRKKLKENREQRQKYEDKKSSENDKRTNSILANFDNIESNLELEWMKSDIDFAKNNPSSFVALHYLFFNLGRSIGRKNFKEIQSAYNAMNIDLRNSPLGIYIDEKLKALERSSIEAIAPDFASEDFFGKKFSLSDFSNKVVLLDFWASWCVPCIRQHPFLHQINNQYKDSGLVIISISKDSDISAWKKSVEKENMNWINTIVTEKSQTMIDAYAAQSIPVILLIDKTGKIIGRWTGYDPQYNTEIQKMISEQLR